MQVQHQESDSIREILDGIAVKHAEAGRRAAEAIALEAENRKQHQDAVGREEVRKAKAGADEVEERVRAVRHANRRGWIWLAVSVLLAAVFAAGVAPVSPPIGESETASWAPAALTSARSQHQDAEDDEAMIEKTNEVVGHLSSSKFQTEIEQVMVKILGAELGIDLSEHSVEYHGAKMKVDGVDDNKTVFVEAFAHVGAFKSGQRRKVATDVLKFVALRGEHPDAKFILAFVDAAAMDSVVGWVRAVTEQHGIKLVVVDVPAAAIEKLVTTQLDQKTGMETGGDAAPPH